MKSDCKKYDMNIGSTIDVVGALILLSLAIFCIAYGICYGLFDCPNWTSTVIGICVVILVFSYLLKKALQDENPKLLKKTPPQ